MGSSKKHKEHKDKGSEKERKRKRKHKSRSRSKSHDREGRTERKKHKLRDKKHGEGSSEKIGHGAPDYYEPKYEEGEIEGYTAESTSHSQQSINPFPEFPAMPSGGTGGGGELSLSIAETNRLRAKLGLKPLDMPGVKSQDDDKPSKKEDVHVPAVNMAQVQQTDALRQKMALIREKRKINQKLGKVKKLGGSDSDDEDVLAWVKKSRKLEQEKALAQKRAKMLEEMDEEFGIGDIVDEEFGANKKNEYGSRDLKGLEVHHDHASFKEGRSIILTLKDQGILDKDQKDVLMNVNMIDDETAARNVDLRKKKASYNPYDEPEIDEYGFVREKDVLSKYDEEIHGRKQESFHLGTKGHYDADHERTMKLYKSALINKGDTLVLEKPQIASEFYTPREMEGFKKVKKKVRKIRKKPKTMKADDLLPLNGEDGMMDLGNREQAKEEGEIYMDAEASAIPGLDLVELPVTLEEPEEEEPDGPEEDLTGVPVDDEAAIELQQIISRTQKLKQKKRHKGEKQSAPAHVLQMAEKIQRTEVKEETDEEDEEDEDGMVTSKRGQITLNSTSEFCRSLGEIPTYGQAGNRPEEEEDELLDFERELQEERRRKLEEADQAGTGWQSVEIDTRPIDLKEEEHMALDDEPVVDSGLASALQLASKKGFLEESVNKKKMKIMTKASIEMEAKNYSIEDKRHDDLDDKYRKRGDRYSGGIMQDFKELDTYKPEIKLEYVDEAGRPMNPKEAFRQLSHRFHGKGSGKKKQEKRSKKHEQEQLLKSASSTDTPLGTVGLLRNKQKNEKTPYLVLSGNKTLTAGNIAK